MSTKKSFSIPSGLASGLRTSIQSANTNQGQLHYDMMSVEAIELDPENPRKLLITRDEIFNGIDKNDPEFERKTKELDALNDLAASIRKVGIRNAIEVYKDDSIYRIISGERRYLAALLATQKYVPTRINQKLDEFKLRYIQWVENINREDLSLWEKYNNLLLMESAYNKTATKPLNADILKELLGVSSRQSYRYLSLLTADKDIIVLIKSGKLTSLKMIEQVCAVKSKSLRKQMLEGIATEHDFSAIKLNNLTDKRIANKNVINLGKISHIPTAKFLMKIILKNTSTSKHKLKFENLDWSSATKINKAFKNLWKALETELDVEETADEV